MQTGDNTVAYVTKSGSGARKFCSTTMQGLIRPKQSRHSCRNSSERFSGSLHTVQTSLPAITPFWPPKKGSEGQTIHLGRRRQAVHAELVHNADSHSTPCVAVGQEPGPILLTYRYWFLFLGLRLDSFLMSLIVQTLTWIYRSQEFQEMVKCYNCQ